MVKARFSSLVTKLGITTIIGSSSTASSLVSGISTSAMPQYISMLGMSLHSSIKRLRGIRARSKNSSWVISSAW